MEETKGIFRIDRKTIYRWKRRKKENKLEADNNLKRRFRKIDPVALEEYVKNNPSATLKEMGEIFKAQSGSVHWRLKKLGITYKKTILYKERDENNRKEYKETLEKEKKEEIIFIDESGINHQGIKEERWSLRREESIWTKGRL
jgi:transposase